MGIGYIGGAVYAPSRFVSGLCNTEIVKDSESLLDILGFRYQRRRRRCLNGFDLESTHLYHYLRFIRKQSMHSSSHISRLNYLVEDGEAVKLMVYSDILLLTLFQVPVESVAFRYEYDAPTFWSASEPQQRCPRCILAKFHNYSNKFGLNSWQQKICKYSIA